MCRLMRLLALVKLPQKICAGALLTHVFSVADGEVLQM